MSPQNKKTDKNQIPAISKSKYEFNMAEFPFSLISSNRLDRSKITSIIYEDTINGKNGQIIPRKWEVSPVVSHGFGSTQMISLVFELMQICKEQEFASPIIRFESLYNLLKRMGLKNESTTYKRLRHDLEALVGLTFNAKNAFWDNEKKAYVDMMGHFFDSVKFYHRESGGEQGPLPFSYIKISEQLWGSIKANALMTLNVNSAFFHSLTPTEQRLGLYLAKMLYSAPEHKRDVILLGKQLPVLGKEYKTIKNQITRASQGLIKKGFPYLASYRYEKNSSGNGENIFFIRANNPIQSEDRKNGQELQPSDLLRIQHDEKKETDRFTNSDRFVGGGASFPLEEKFEGYGLTEDILKVCGDPKSRRAYSIIASKLPTETIYLILSEIRQEYPGTFRGSRGSMFIVKAKQEASRLDIDLGFNLS
jgi:hypothetical protein